MRKLNKQLFLAGLALLVSLQFAQAFSFGGPGLGGGTGGDAWQQPIIGYGLNPGPVGVDLNTPKNLGEEYRRVTPVMYYASDASFLDFFGLAGSTNIDLAFAIMNGVMCGQTNASLFLNSPTNGILSSFNNPYVGTPVTLNALNNLNAYPVDLGDFPLESQQLNYTAGALGLSDLKSETLQMLIEQMGLTQPERYAWTLHDRFQQPFPGSKCPDDMLYLVVQRNFDVIDSPLNQVQYSPYVNGTLYTFNIFEVCKAPFIYLPGTVAVTVPIAVNIFADSYTAVASFRLLTGGFYTGLTRDDAAGLRYLYSTNNIKYEATAPSGGVLLQTNVQAPQLFGPTLPISLLFSQSLNSDPNALQALYPGITYLSVTTNFVNLPTTNIIAYFTNLAGPFTNRVPLSNNVAIYPAQGSTVPFTNWSPVQYGDPPILLTTQPLAPLLYLSQFLSPLELQRVYPDVLIDRVLTNYLAVDITTNIAPYFTNQSVLPTFTGVTNGLPQVTTLTNIYFFTNQPGPTVINYDFSQPYQTISTLDLALFSDRAATNGPAALQALYPGLEILHVNTQPGFGWVTNYVSYLTNYTGSPYNGLPKLVTLAVSTNFVAITNWLYTFGNVFTNHFYTNRTYKVTSIWITNLTGAPFGSPFIGKTNTITYTTNKVSGDFFLVPTNWCGFDLRLAFPLGNPPYTFSATNTIVYPGYNPSTGSAGTNAAVGGTTYGLTQSFLYQYTNYNYAVYPGICQPVLRFGTNYATNAIYKYQYNFINVVTNHYYTNSLINLFTTNVFAIPGNPIDVLGTNIFNTSYYTNLPGGDFYTVPNTWCGYQIVALLTNLIAPTNIVFTNQSLGTNLQYTYVQYLVYTNYTYSVRPGVCEPALAFTTNLTTNTIPQYSYYFGNIITNHYFTNGTAMVITTNQAIWTNGLVGMITNLNTTNYVPGVVGGDFYIIPPQFCDFTILSTQLTTAVFSTNTILIATNLSGVQDLGQQYSQTVITSYTNTTFQVRPSTCDTATPQPALRQGIGGIKFIRANYDSLVGQFFAPITNLYSMSKVTNSQSVKEYYQRVITQPDFLIRAQDLTVGPSALPVVNSFTRNLAFDQSTRSAVLAGPGTILPGTTVSFNKVGNIYLNGTLNTQGLSTNAFLNESTQISALAWASFDLSTNDPVVYPSGTSLANLANQLIIQVTPLPPSLTPGTSGVAYAPVTFTATGGQPPYSWAIPNLAGLVPGMSFDATTATLSGTPTGVGTFSFTLQLTDAVNRAISLNYSIIIH